MSETGDLITRIYGSFRGADFRGEEINLMRSPDCLNVWKNYRNTDSIETRPAMALSASFPSPIYGIFFYKGFTLVHSGTSLYKVTNGAKTVLFSGLNASTSDGFVYEDIFYFKDGKYYLQYDGKTATEVEGFIPTTSIGRKPKGGGTVYQDVNMLSPYRINTFLADGENVKKTLEHNGVEVIVREGSTEFWLDTNGLDDSYTPEVKVDGKTVHNYTIDYENGKITFQEAPLAPLTDGQDNVWVKFKKMMSLDDDGEYHELYEKYRKCIDECTLLQVFDNRVFFSGNKDYPNYVWHCSLDDPTYVSDLDYYREGMDSAKVTGLVAGNNALWVFREPSDANTTVFYHTPTIDSEYGKIYPSQHSSITTGCVGKAVNFNDDIVFFSERGMEGISGDVTTEQAVAHRSSFVDRKMIAESNYRNMCLAEWEGYLLVFIGNKVYLADSRTAFSYENHIEYDWFYWELEKAVTCAKVHDGILYLGTADGVYTMCTETDENGAYIPLADIESYWVTPKDKFKSPHKLKTTNKRGCVAEATGDIEVFAKIEDTGFESIGAYENVTDYFVCRIKRKKWKDIQLKFYSKTRFSLETATLEAFVGGYIKR